MNRKLPSLTSIAVLTVLSIGCGPSDAEKGAAAVARLQNRPKPGYVRVVNLSGSPVAVLKNGNPLTAEVGDGAFSRLVPLKSGKSSLSVGGRDVAVDLTPEEGTSVVLFRSGPADQIKGEIRKPTTSGNVAVYIAPGDGSVKFPLSGIKIEGPAKGTIKPDTKHLSLEPGEYQVGGETVKIEDKLAYTFLFVPQRTKMRAFLMLNTPNEKPGGTGASAS